MMQNSVASGYRSTAARCHRRRSSGHIATAHHVDHPMCMLGIAAYWLEMSAIVSESNDHGPPYSASVSTKPNRPRRRRTADALPMHSPPYRRTARRAGAAASAGTARTRRSRARSSPRGCCATAGRPRGRLRNSTTNTPSVTMKWAVAVVRVPELDERAVRQEPAPGSTPRGTAPTNALDADDPLGVVERVLGDAVGRDAVGTEAVPGPRVHEVEGGR